MCVIQYFDRTSTSVMAAVCLCVYAYSTCGHKLLPFVCVQVYTVYIQYVCVLTCLLAHVCGQVWRTRAEVLVAVWQEGRQRVHPVRLLHHRHFVGLLTRHKGGKLTFFFMISYIPT